MQFCLWCSKCQKIGAGWLLGALSRITHEIDLTQHSVLSNTPAKWEVHWRNISWNTRRTVIHECTQTDLPFLIVRWCCYSPTYWPNSTTFVMATQTPNVVSIAQSVQQIIPGHSIWASFEIALQYIQLIRSSAIHLPSMHICPGGSVTLRAQH